MMQIQMEHLLHACVVARRAKVIQLQSATPRNSHLKWGHKQSLSTVQNFPFIEAFLKNVSNFTDGRAELFLKGHIYPPSQTDGFW